MGDIPVIGVYIKAFQRSDGCYTRSCAEAKSWVDDGWRVSSYLRSEDNNDYFTSALYWIKEQGETWCFQSNSKIVFKIVGPAPKIKLSDVKFFSGERFLAKTEADWVIHEYPNICVVGYITLPGSEKVKLTSPIINMDLKRRTFETKTHSVYFWEEKIINLKQVEWIVEGEHMNDENAKIVFYNLPQKEIKARVTEESGKQYNTQTVMRVMWDKKILYTIDEKVYHW